MDQNVSNTGLDGINHGYISKIGEDTRPGSHLGTAVLGPIRHKY